MQKGIFIVSVLLSIFFLACNKVSDFGEDLGLDDVIDVDFTTEIPISWAVEIGDTILAYSETTVLTSYLCGKFQDPKFGIATANLNFQVNLSAPPEFENATFDSVVLSIAYDTTLQGYGNVNTAQSYRVYELDEDLVESQDYYSNYDPAIGELLGARIDVEPRFGQNTVVVEPTPIGLDTFLFPPVLRFRLDDAFGEKILFADSMFFQSLDNFRLLVKGFSMQPLNEADGIHNFDLSSPFTRLNVYYSQGDTLPLIHTFPVLSNSVRFSTFSHDYAGTEIDNALNNDVDSLLFLQSMQGIAAVLEFGDLLALEATAINNAILELTIFEEEENQDSLYPLIDQLIMIAVDEEGNRSFISDLGEFLGSSALPTFFGGSPIENNSGQSVYRMNITQYLQEVLRGESSARVEILSANRTSSAARSIVYGPNSSFPPIIRVTYTDIE